jgi:uncharacterized protein YkwD
VESNPKPRYDSIASLSDIKNIEARSMQLVTPIQTNDFRTSQGKPPLAWKEALVMIGRVHSDNMGRGVVPFGHQGFDDRVKQFPFSFMRGAAENVAYNNFASDSAKTAVDGWIKSPGHRKNMLDDFNICGIGVVRAENGSWYFTQLFARI